MATAPTRATSSNVPATSTAIRCVLNSLAAEMGHVLVGEDFAVELGQRMRSLRAIFDLGILQHARRALA